MRVLLRAVLQPHIRVAAVTSSDDVWPRGPRGRTEHLGPPVNKRRSGQSPRFSGSRTSRSGRR